MTEAGEMPRSIACSDTENRNWERMYNDKPVCFAQLLNTFSVKGGWQFELGGM